MIPGAFQQVTVVRLRYPRIMDHGVARADYTATAERLPIVGCWAEPTETQEVSEGRLAVRTGWAVAGPPDLDLVADDHVEMFGLEYDITGDVLPIPSVTGALRSTKFNAVRWEG